MLMWTLKRKAKISEDETNLRIDFLGLLETLWLSSGDYRFGQLIVNIIDKQHPRILSNDQVKRISTADWINYVNQIKDLTSEEYNGFDPRRNPKRIPEVIKLVNAEWLENSKTFGQYLLDRQEKERPGGGLYGYEIHTNFNE
ncbi:hypothetical protein [Bacillus sp. FJAT-28004]|uniref:hypothetical protein n=1 Tax=Bacillus sp. FJAT-28004 TaxID=1679165 RepID=UPI00128F90C6|nr:hypothetical protein [Bacillus sp. FJAT-28004]